MAGVRGFADPNVQINPDGKSTFEQCVKATQEDRCYLPQKLSTLEKRRKGIATRGDIY